MIKIKELSPKAQSLIATMKEKHKVKTNARAVIKALEDYAEVLKILDNAEALTQKGGE